MFVFEKMYDNGFRQMTSSTRPIEKPADLKGLPIRVPPSPLSTSLFKAFGAAPQSISFGEVYTALQTKLVEAQENPLSLVETAKFYEVQKYVSMTNHMWDGFWILANRASWGRLPKPMQDVVDKRFNEAALLEREDVAKLNDSIAGKLKAAGMTVHRAEPADVPRRAQRHDLLCRMEGEIRREGLGDAGKVHRQARMSVAAERPRRRRLAASDRAHGASALIDGVERWLGAVVDAVAAVLLLIDIVLLGWAVTGRYVFRVPVTAVEELATLIFLWFGMLGVASALRRGMHMRLSFVLAKLPAHVRAPCRECLDDPSADLPRAADRPDDRADRA